ncbi:hypothetical protein CEW46_27655 [Bacillus cereus]|nr:hypothetical protein CEW46_27655 [Bacillus cereus]
MKMTVKESIDYVIQGTGLPYTETMFSKIKKFLELLPHNPKGVNHITDACSQYYIMDYEQSWYVRIEVVAQNHKIIVGILDTDGLGPNPDRVKTNHEALELMKQYKEIKYPEDIDKHWRMSDDHRYWRRMQAMDDEANNRAEEILRKLS